MARRSTSTKKAVKPATKSRLKKAGKPRNTSVKKTSKPALRAQSSSVTTQPPAPASISNRTKRHLYRYRLRDNATSLSQIIGIGMAILAFVVIISAIVRYAYINRPSHVKAVAQTTEYEKAIANCGHKPYLVVTKTNDYGEQRSDYYTPGFSDYEAQAKKPAADSSETKRFDCELDAVLVAYATPHYSADERADVAAIYKDYASAKGMRFLAPSFMPAGYKLVRQTLSSNRYSAAYSATGDETIDGYFTACSLLRDAPQPSKVAEYRNAEHAIAQTNLVTVYGDRTFTIDNQPKNIARFSESGDMWCSFTQNGERLITNEDITSIMSTFTDQPAETVLLANPVATE